MQFSLERKMSPVKGLVNIESIKAEEDYTKQRLKSRLSNTTLIQKLSTNPHWNCKDWFFTVMLACKNKWDRYQRSRLSRLDLLEI